MKNLRKPAILSVFLLTLLVGTIAAAQENKNRRGDGSSVLPEAVKTTAPSKQETKLEDEGANSQPASNKDAAQKARRQRQRHRRNRLP